MSPMRIAMLFAAAALLVSAGARAEDVGCVNTAFKLIGPDHKVCVEAFTDPDIPGVACYLSQARTGGVSGWLGLAEDPSRFALTCHQIGPITLPNRIDRQKEVFDSATSILFKETQVVRMYDRPRNTLVYLSYSTKLVDDSPMNSVAAVPVMPWAQ